MEKVLIEYNKNKEVTSAGYCVSDILNIDKPLCVPLGLVCDNDIFNTDLDRQICQYVHSSDVCKMPNIYDKMLDLVQYKSTGKPKSKPKPTPKPSPKSTRKNKKVLNVQLKRLSKKMK